METSSWSIQRDYVVVIEFFASRCAFEDAQGHRMNFQALLFISSNVKGRVNHFGRITDRHTHIQCLHIIVTRRSEVLHQFMRSLVCPKFLSHSDEDIRWLFGCLREFSQSCRTTNLHPSGLPSSDTPPDGLIGRVRNPFDSNNSWRFHGMRLLSMVQGFQTTLRQSLHS